MNSFEAKKKKKYQENFPLNAQNPYMYTNEPSISHRKTGHEK